MIGVIARRELLEHVRSPRFLVLCALAVVLLPLAAHVNATRLRARQAQAAALRSAAEARAAVRATESSVYASRYGWRTGEPLADPALRAIREPPRLAVLVAGAEATMPAYWQFGTEGLEAGPSELASETGDGAERMDAVFIVQVVLGLLAMLLVFDAVSGERESGVLRLLLSTPVRRADVILGKALGAAATLTLPLMLGLAAALLALQRSGVSLLDADSLVRLAVFLLASVLYLTTMMAMALAVSASTARARTSWIVVLVLWIGVALVGPRTAQMVAAAVHPVPSAFALRTARDAALRQLDGERARAKAEAWRAISGGDDVPDGGIDPGVRAAYRAATAELERGFADRKRAAIRLLDAERRRAARRQAVLADRLALASPAASFAALAGTLAGTGRDARERWEEQVEAHQARLESATFDRVFGLELFPAALGRLRIVWWPDLRDPADLPPAYRELPPFAFEPPPLRETVGRAVPAALRLGAGAVGWLLLAVVLFVRAELQ